MEDAAVGDEDLMKSTDVLSNEHKLILRALGVLEAMIVRMERKEVIDRDDTANLLRFFQMYADQAHHAKEEAILFPALEAAGLTSEGGPVGCMLREHEQARSLVAGMNDATRREDPSEFVRHGSRYVTLLREHIQKEDQILFPMARRFLTDVDDEQILTAFRRMDNELTEDTLTQFDTVVGYLETQHLGESRAV